jgi:hypothetical protein
MRGDKGFTIQSCRTPGVPTSRLSVPWELLHLQARGGGNTSKKQYVQETETQPSHTPLAPLSGPASPNWTAAVLINSTHVGHMWLVSIIAIATSKAWTSGPTPAAAQASASAVLFA